MDDKHCGIFVKFAHTDECKQVYKVMRHRIFDKRQIIPIFFEKQVFDK